MSGQQRCTAVNSMETRRSSGHMLAWPAATASRAAQHDLIRTCAKRPRRSCLLWASRVAVLALLSGRSGLAEDESALCRVVGVNWPKIFFPGGPYSGSFYQRETASHEECAELLRRHDYDAAVWAPPVDEMHAGVCTFGDVPFEYREQEGGGSAVEMQEPAFCCVGQSKSNCRIAYVAGDCPSWAHTAKKHRCTGVDPELVDWESRDGSDVASFAYVIQFHQVYGHLSTVPPDGADSSQSHPNPPHSDSPVPSDPSNTPATDSPTPTAPGQAEVVVVESASEPGTSSSSSKSTPKAAIAVGVVASVLLLAVGVAVLLVRRTRQLAVNAAAAGTDSMMDPAPSPDAAKLDEMESGEPKTPPGSFTARSGQIAASLLRSCSTAGSSLFSPRPGASSTMGSLSHLLSPRPDGPAAATAAPTYTPLRPGQSSTAPLSVELPLPPKSVMPHRASPPKASPRDHRRRSEGRRSESRRAEGRRLGILSGDNKHDESRKGLLQKSPSHCRAFDIAASVHAQGTCASRRSETDTSSHTAPV